jgi:hypothetical protein
MKPPVPMPPLASWPRSASLSSGGRECFAASASRRPVAAVVFLSGLLGTAYIGSGIGQLGFLLLALWTLMAGICLLVRPVHAASR